MGEAARIAHTLPPSLCDQQELQQIVVTAIERFLISERQLLIIDANERSLSHKLAEYLARALPANSALDVDCEYNRLGSATKRLVYPHQTSTADTDGTTVFPDIILHKRACHEWNLLVIEMKKSTSSESSHRDLDKLRAFVADRSYQYCFGLFLEVSAGADTKNGCWAKGVWCFLEADGSVSESRAEYRPMPPQ